MLKLQCEVKGLKELNKTINLIENLTKLQTSKKFQKYMQEKALETVNKITNERLTGGTTNDTEIQLYKSSHHIQKEENGFILYNNAKIPANTKIASNYPEGNFSIALAFEYGTGITGEGTYDGKYFQAWNYNINDYNFGWYYLDKSGNKQHTYGYMGFEIYRYTVEEIRNQLSKWVNDYIRKYGGVSK